MRGLPDLEGWAVFARVAEARSFSRAAAELGVSPATVSRMVARLERRLGGALLSRTSRRFSLTSLGEGVAERAHRLLGEATALEGIAGDRVEQPAGLVRIAAPMAFGQLGVAPLLPRLLREHPGMRLDLHLGDALVDLVGEGFDFALRIGRLPSSSLRVRPIAEMAMLLVAAPSLLGNAPPSHPRELRAYPCFAYSYASVADRWTLSHGSGEQASVPVGGRLRMNNGEAMLPCLLAGLGVAALPEFVVAEALRGGALRTLLPGWSLPGAPLSLVMPPNTLRPAVVNAAADFFARELAAGCLAAKTAP